MRLDNEMNKRKISWPTNNIIDFLRLIWIIQQKSKKIDRWDAKNVDK